jgi:hypothetical protein
MLCTSIISGAKGGNWVPWENPLSLPYLSKNLTVLSLNTKSNRTGFISGIQPFIVPRTPMCNFSSTLYPPKVVV